MLTSKEVLEKTGISRATLNNYIGSGIVPRPEVRSPQPSDGAAPRIGYFPANIVQRIEEIQRLKREGWTMARIKAHFAPAASKSPAKPAAPARKEAAAAPEVAGEASSPAPTLQAPDTRHDIRMPASVRRPPVLTHVAVLVAELQDAQRLWGELPPEDYFELVYEIWATVDPAFLRHGGTLAKHPGEGMVCYFLPRPDSNYLWNSVTAAQEVREAMRRVSQEWRLRKSLSGELFVNIGIDEGQEWRGTLRRNSDAGFTSLGDPVNRALRISGFARDGAIWLTKNLVGKLPGEERKRLKYGVRRRTRDGETVLLASTFATLENLADLRLPGNESLVAIAQVPVTEIVDIGPQST
ncbi:MAG TPA: adenylate/guanylate cyclase domain-containing protein [Ramlibacter sp.]|nr:adenylate/guanylate cyclase domain-containing protein [Ramlibacter sp.]